MKTANTPKVRARWDTVFSRKSAANVVGANIKILKYWLQCHLPSGSFPTFAREFPDLLGKTDVLGLESEESVVYTLKPSKNRLVLVFCSTSSKKVWSLEMKSQIRNTEQSQWCGCTKLDLSGQTNRTCNNNTTDFLLFSSRHQTRLLNVFENVVFAVGVFWNKCVHQLKCSPPSTGALQILLKLLLRVLGRDIRISY